MEAQILYWTKLAAIGQLAGAIATAAAVIFSVWVIFRDRRFRLHASAHLFNIAEDPGLVISFANNSPYPVKVLSFGWRVGLLPWLPGPLGKSTAIQPLWEIQLPVLLSPGEHQDILMSSTEVDKFAPFMAEQARFGLKVPFLKQRIPNFTRLYVDVVGSAHVRTTITPLVARALAERYSIRR